MCIMAGLSFISNDNWWSRRFERVLHQAICDSRHGIYQASVLRAWGPFLEGPGNFTGPKSNIQIEI